MKKKVLFVMSMLLCSYALWAQNFTLDGVYYSVLRAISPTTAKVVENPNYYSGMVVIPSTVTYDGTIYTVTAIDDSAFMSCTGLTSISLPSTITSIGEFAFYGCTGLTFFNMPDAVVSVGNYAFMNCTSLTSIVLSSSLTELSQQMFDGCSLLSSISVPASVKEIKYWAFNECTSLESATLNSGLKRIWNDAFSFCSDLDSIVIPNTVTYMGAFAFHYDTDLQKVVIGTAVDSIDFGCFSNCRELDTLIIPASVSWISVNAFEFCTDLDYFSVDPGNTTYKSVDSLLYSKDGTILYVCPAGMDDSVFVQNSVTTVEPYAFYECSDIDYLVFGGQVTKMGAFALGGCTGLEALVCKATTPPVAQSSTFFNVVKTIPLYVPSGSKTAYSTADYWSDFTNISLLSTTDNVDIIHNEIQLSVDQESVLYLSGLQISTNTILRIVDLAGRVILSKTITSEEAMNGMTLDLSPFNSGYYLLQIDHFVEPFIVP